ncbi:MAG: 30S ribosomal protein S7 [Candidatus Doudnabacteria bacterium CG10_big_fil_rev_8_21_14_0_10_41_10]|uniref:Small ribosomal subunit protein uS7 n=1 Tax=Candidatus Doudnabacteria bacterium CG10_big_fil_rev_8_21_14_0_10_41_10 TaxID=1974551 RepID=A0A2H0VCU7_9BACT|nr:MAG: 30S ribosomal protein S7 [Candidatus Doudnabacteria bacterium CG10_big_fil_rev_8_21_14_0_10_41_10]
MPRKARSYKRHKIAPDPRYNNVKVAKLINYIMERGKKSVAQKIVYTSFDYIKEKMKTEPRQIFDAALKNISPLVEIKGRRVGGANYQVPMEVFEPRRTTLGMRWLITAARSKKGKPMHVRLAEELMEAYNKQGAAFKKKEDTHRMAEANKAFAHFARFGKKKK